MSLYTKQSVANYIADSLRKRISRGEFETVNQKLPSEQALAEEYGVGRSSIREALRTLQAENAIRIEKGRGSYVLSPTAQTQAVGKWYKTKAETVSDLLEVRLALESLATRKCVENATASDLTQLKSINNAFRSNAEFGDYEMLKRLDEAFHSTIVEISKISLLTDLYRRFELEYAEFRVKGFIFTKHIEKAARGHERIITAIEEKDEEKAIEATRDHIFEVVEDVNKILTVMDE